jgi:hypothetical protein
VSRLARFRTIRRDVRRFLLATALLLALAPSALAVPAPPAKSPFIRLDAPQGKTQTHSCAKGGSQKQVKLPGFRATGDLAHKAVVACEQPPRSQPFSTILERAETAALLALVG